MRNAAEFIAAAGWADAMISPLAGDASNRRYDRLASNDGRRAVLMDAPPQTGEDVRPFLRITRFLRAQGLSAPDILHADPANGFLLIEDLGDARFAEAIAADPQLERPLYRAAAEVLVHLHHAPPPDDMPVYSAAATVPLAALAYDWYRAATCGPDDTTPRDRFCAAFHPIVAAYDDELDVLIQRDYHAENLLWLPQRSGVARVGLLDYQDAMRGHRAYDLVSVLQDARRDVPADIEAEIRRDFISASGLPAQTFEKAYAVFGLQRNLRILGVFVRLCLRDGKPRYVDLLPRVWGHVLSNLRHPALAPLVAMLRADLPEPTPDIMARLKQRSGTWAGR